MFSRVLEPEVMDTESEAIAYDQMDHHAVNAQYIDDLLETWAWTEPAGRSLLEQPGLRLLDLGTATAQVIVELLARGGDLQVVAIDAAAAMLARGQQNLRGVAGSQQVLLAQADAKRLPVADTSFEIVASNSILHHIPNPAELLPEAVRVCSPGGLIYFRDLLRPRDVEELDWIVATYAAGADAQQRQLFRDSLHAALSLEEMRELVHAFGFARHSVQQSSDRHWTWAARKSI
jgi:ubiquinone/menaquinone biosynthesis C-methylase UbiE